MAKEEEMMRRALQLVTDKKLRTRYFDEINNEATKLERDPKAFCDLVN